MYSVVINGVDRTLDITANTIRVEDNLNDQINSCSFSMSNRSALGAPDTDQEIIITLADATILFAGTITKIVIDKAGAGMPLMQVSAVDYTRLLDRRLAHVTYENMTDKAIIENLVSTYCAGSGITTVNVIEGVTISSLVLNYTQISQVLRKICDLTGRNWYIDASKDIHYFPLTTSAAPFTIEASGNQYKNLTINRDASQIKNRIYVRGGTKLSDPTTFTTKGNGALKKFILPDKPHDVSVTVGGVSKTVGIKNVNTSGFDWYVNFQEKYIEQDTGGTALSTTDTLIVTYSYDIPILIAQENTSSIADSGVHEFAIFDKQIKTTDAARDRAIAELTDYAGEIIEGSFTTLTTGFRSGQYITVTHADYGISGVDYIITRVSAQALGGGLFEYSITLASAKTMGIIRFLIEMLENNRNILELDPNEVVDELFSITDSLPTLITDSITDTLGSANTTWGADANAGRWDLFQWG